MSDKKEDLVYYVEPLDSNTNYVIACQLPEERACNVKNIKGEKLNVWECDTAFILKLERSRKKENLKFKIYRKDKSNVKRFLK